MTNQLHTCSYFCDRPACIKAQRDDLRERLTKIETAAPNSWYKGTNKTWGNVLKGLVAAIEEYERAL